MNTNTPRKRQNGGGHMNTDQQRIAAGQNAANTTDARALDIGAAAADIRSSGAPHAEAYAAALEAAARGMHAAANGLRSAAPLQTLDAPEKHMRQAGNAADAAQRAAERLPIAPARDALVSEAAALGIECSKWAGVIAGGIAPYTDAPNLRRAFADTAQAFADMAAHAEDRAMQRGHA